VIKWRTKYVHLRQVPDAYLLDIFDNGPDPCPTLDMTRGQKQKSRCLYGMKTDGEKNKVY